MFAYASLSSFMTLETKLFSILYFISSIISIRKVFYSFFNVVLTKFIFILQPAKQRESASPCLLVNVGEWSTRLEGLDHLK